MNGAWIVLAATLGLMWINKQYAQSHAQREQPRYEANLDRRCC